MPAGPIGTCWAPGSWLSTAWEAGSWRAVVTRRAMAGIPAPPRPAVVPVHAEISGVLPAFICQIVGRAERPGVLEAALDLDFDLDGHVVSTDGAVSAFMVAAYFEVGVSVSARVRPRADRQRDRRLAALEAIS